MLEIEFLEQNNMENFESKNFYEILELNRDCSKEQIKKSYYKLAKKYHPDINKNKNSEKIFKKINEAYHVLINEESRTRYDSFLNSDNPTNEIFQNFDFDETWIYQYISETQIQYDQIKKILSQLSLIDKIKTYKFFGLYYEKETIFAFHY